MNDSTTLLLRAKGYEKAPLYNDTVKKLDDWNKPKKVEPTDEEIIANTLKLFE